MLVGPDGSTDVRTIGRQLVYLSLALVFMGALSFVLWDRMRNPNLRPGDTRIGVVEMALPTFDERCGKAEHVLVDVIHSEDKADWLMAGTAEYMQECPNVQVRLHAMSDREAMASIESGELVPALWTPSDSIFVEHLEERWSSQRPTLTHGPSLLRSPMVVLLWEDRAAALDVLLPDLAARPSAWAELACAGVSRGAELPLADLETERPIEWSTWWNATFPVPGGLPARPSLETLQRWGHVDVLHTSPIHSSEGALTLMLLAHAYVAAEADAKVVALRDGFEDALDERQPAVADWLRRCESHGDEPHDDAALLAQRMFQLDAPQGYDGAIVPEHLALVLLDQAGTHEELSRLRVLYPRSTLVMDHPAAFFAIDDEQSRQGAQRLVEFLRRGKWQRAAIVEGFRPGNHAVTLHDGDLRPNWFLELRRFGVMPDLEPVEVPRVHREQLRMLVETWAAVTGRH
jgi:hypothetical protein